MAKRSNSVPYVARRKGSSNLQYVRNIPPKYRKLFNGKKQIWRSLKTSDISIAAIRVKAVDAEVQAVIDRHEMRAFSDGDSSLPWARRAIIKAGGTQEAIDRELRQVPVSAFLPKNEEKLVLEDGKIVRRRPANRKEMLARYKWLLEQAKDHRFEAERAKDATAIASYAVDVYRFERIIEWLEDGEGKVDHEYGEPPIERTLSELIETHLTHYTKTKNSKSLSIKRHRLALLADALGHDREITTIKATDVAPVVKDLLPYVPKTIGKNLAGLSPLQRIERVRRDGLQTINESSQKLYLSEWNSFFTSPAVEDYLPKNPCRGLRPPGSNNPKRKRETLTIDELQSVFSGPVYKGCDPSARAPWKTSGGTVIKDHKYWVPLIALFSGATLAEVCDLAPEDVTFESGVPVLKIHEDEARNRTVKTEHRSRLVPIHKVLLKAGLMEYAKKQSGPSLFPELEANASRSTPVGKWFSRYVEWSFPEDHKGLSFHCFRHTFREAGRKPGIVTDHVLAIAGWKRGEDASDQYGRTHLPDLKKTIDQIEYEGLDLSHI